MIEILVLKSESPDAYEGCGYNPISYKVEIGCEGDEHWGLCVGEARAKLVNDHYLLEETKDVDNRSYDDGRGEKQPDTRRFEPIGVLDLSDKARADEVLHRYALSRANHINVRTGLGINDLSKKSKRKASA